MAKTIKVNRLVGSCVDEGIEEYKLVDVTVKEEGEQLFEHFLFDQITQDKENVPVLKDTLPPRTPAPVNKPQLTDTAARLCELAATFANTEERKMVRETAMSINADISCEELAVLLITMMKNTHHLEEGIVVLFYFCFDLAMRVLQNGFGEFWDFISLCKESLLVAVGPQVQAHGGWAQVIKLAKSGSAFLGMVATGVFVAARVGAWGLLFL